MATKLVPTGETVVEAEAEIAGERGKADGVLILLVEEVGHAASEGDAARDEVGGCEIEARVAGIVRDAETEKIAVGADAGKVAGEIQIPAAIAGVDDEASGVDRAAKEMIARKLDGIEGVRGFQDTRIVIRIVAVDAEPAAEAEFAGKIDAAGASEIRVEVCASAVLAGGSGCGIDGEADDVAEAIVEIGGGETQAVGGEELVDAGVVGLAALGAKRGIAGEAGIAAEGLFERGFLKALTVGKARARVAPKAFAVAEGVNDAGAGNDASAERSVGLGARAGAERQARNGKPAGIEKAGLIIAAGVKAGDEARVAVLDFIFVAGGNGPGSKRVRGLLLETGAIELVDRGEEGRIAVGVERAIFVTADAMGPMGAGAEVPA